MKKPLCLLSIAFVSAWFMVLGMGCAPRRQTGTPITPANHVANWAPEGCPFIHDFEQPQYDGMDNLQFIDNEWVLVVNEYWQEAKARAKELAEASEEGKDLWSYKDKWDRWSWYKKWSPIEKKYLKVSYTNYLSMGDPSFFTISSDNDRAYKKGRHPERAIRWHQQIGDYMTFHYAENIDTAQPLLGSYGYLKLPEPMKPGKTYTITQGDGRKVTFTWSEDRCVSRAIKVNQNGYATAVGTKYAYLGLWVPTMGPFDFGAWDGQAFEVVPVGGGVPVLTGTVRLKEKNPHFTQTNRETKQVELKGAICGEDVYELDISGLKEVGDFYIRIPGVGRSWPFTHSPNVYGRAYYLAMRGMFHQRCGQELSPEYTAWPRKACHTNAGECAMTPLTPYMRVDKVDVPVSDFKAIERTAVDPLPNGPTGRGGWHDAADFDRRWWHYMAVWDLLFAFELAPEYFTDGQLHIPESGNGIPDMLDEAAYGLLCWRNTQNQEGGISGRIEQTEHPQYAKWGMPDKDPKLMYNSLRTREFSLRYAGSAAQLARLMKPFDRNEAGGWLDSARKAYAFGMDTNNMLNIPDYAGSGEPVVESTNWVRVTQCYAGAEMYLATGKKQYLDDGLKEFDYTAKTMKHPFKATTYVLPYAITEDEGVPEAVKERAKRWYLDRAEYDCKCLAEQPYPYSLPRDWPWGYAWGNGTMTKYSRTLLIAYYLTGKSEQRFLDAAALNADFMLGCNPLGVSWMSGCGYNYPTVFFDAESEMDGIDDPVPGITVYGVTGGIGMGARRLGYFWLNNFKKYDPENGDIAFCPPPFDDLGGISGIPTWRRWTPDYHSDPALQEFTVWETMSVQAFTFGLLMNEGWRPDATLLNLKPRPKELLFGDYLTP